MNLLQYKDSTDLRTVLLDDAYRQGHGGVPMTAIATIGVVVIHWINSGSLLSPLWLGTQLGVTALRGMILIYDTRCGHQLGFELRRHLLTIPMLATTLAWAVLPYLIFPTAGPEEQLGLICVMSGLAGGAASVLAPLQWVGRLYIICMLMPGAVLVYGMPGAGPVISALGFCFMVVMLMTHAQARKVLVVAHTRLAENQRLLGNIQTHQRAAERLNDELLATQDALRRQNASLEDEVEKRTARIRLAFSVIENTTEGVMVMTTDGTVVEVNPAFTVITGYPPEEAIGGPSSVLRSNKHEASDYDQMWQLLRKHGKWEGELWSRKRDGSVFLEHRVVDAVRDEYGHIVHYVSIFNDVTESHYKDEQLRHLAFHDPLTGLGNRSLLQENLVQGIALADRHKSRLAVLFFDLDQFKAINDNLGHQVGDRLLQAVALRLKENLRTSDTLARLGGDEFVVVMNDIRDSEDCAVLAAKVLREISTPFDLDESRIHVRSSVGIAIYPDDGRDVQTLMRNADMAMYAAKSAGRDTFRFFHATLSEDAHRRMEMEAALQDAIAMNQLSLHYQPKVAPTSGRVEGYEALLRWQLPPRGFISPDNFIPVAEDSGLIRSIGAWVVAEACAQIARWHQQGFGWQHVAINVSAKQLLQDDLLEIIRVETRRQAVPPDLLEIEVTESVLVSKPEQAIHVLQNLRTMGVTVAIDDFGTGHSSLAYLRRLPVDVLKIDRAFVQDSVEDAHAQAIIRMILALSKTLDLKVVAEGVETQEQADLLHAGGCDLLQGYLFAHPAPAVTLEAGWQIH